MNADPAMIGS